MRTELRPKYCKITVIFYDSINFSIRSTSREEPILDNHRVKDLHEESTGAYQSSFIFTDTFGWKDFPSK